eukprot:scaffold7028_cov40-Cyclotella_meneghiniana.AAC.2
MLPRVDVLLLSLLGVLRVLATSDKLREELSPHVPAPIVLGGRNLEMFGFERVGKGIFCHLSRNGVLDRGRVGVMVTRESVNEICCSRVNSYLHISPLTGLYPPMPVSHASLIETDVGIRKITKLIDMPSLA